jgi:hypothetical protein
VDVPFDVAGDWRRSIPDRVGILLHPRELCGQLGGKVIDLLLSGERGRMREAMLDIAARRQCARALGVIAT